MLSTMTYRQAEHTDSIQQMQAAYRRALIAPMDGMWESAVIAPATFWEIQDGGRHAGYFCVGANNNLLRFHLVEAYLDRAQEVFRWIVSAFGFEYAMTSTIEPLYFTLCLDLQTSVVVHSYLFRDNQHIELSAGFGKCVFRKARERELDELTRFYQANTEGSGAWIEPFLREHLRRGEVFGFYDQQTVVATGECIPSQHQPPYADLGMVVAHASRGRGLGSSMLIRLKQHCYEAGWKPICSCARDNRASKKAIEKAGFISEHRIVKMSFSGNESAQAANA